MCATLNTILSFHSRWDFPVDGSVCGELPNEHDLRTFVGSTTDAVGNPRIVGCERTSQ